MASPNSTSTSTEPRVITGWKRVAWPVLRAQPLEMSVASLPDSMKKMSQAILQRANTIAGKHRLLKGMDGITHFQMRATKGKMNTLALHRYGVLPDLKANPATIYISVIDDSDETRWHEVVADIKKMLQGEEGWGHLNVHMEHNENWAGPLFD
ncbi:uncharacterized protein FTJAE_6960 [Fusarium tjaetaba]|uniref:Uncharacterized protein n=1 Tax=Fusarium tjaetaba TaxID=1567544 RepID=A0A8H5RIK2_9HYPO|nr:uncharacterized protein FTJAE_6960 [Fusarium tjaetaba]KAF5633809.1 hypothetical protein FTJAE_6960 [Fusarium tjaetaba]